MTRKPVYPDSITKEQVTGILKQRHSGSALTCSVCGLAGQTLVKDGKEGYRHERRDICTLIRRRQPRGKL